MAACAAPSPPLPPSLELPTPVNDLHAVRNGNSVVLTWTLPQETTDGDGIRFYGPTRVCRSFSPSNEGPSIEPAILSNCSVATELKFAELETTKAAPASKTPQRVTAHYTDALPPDSQSGSTTVTYAIELLNTDRRGAGLSNQVTAATAATGPPPTDFAAQLTDEGVVLTWTGPLLSLPAGDGTPRYFYRIFRNEKVDANANPASTVSAKKEPPPELVGEILQGTQDKMRLVDTSLVWEKTYEYRIHLTTRIASGPPHACPGETSPLPACRDSLDIPGLDSPPITLFAHDTFPPAVPTALQAVFSGAGQKPFIDLTWNANTDSDLAGYNIYRRDAGQNPSQAVRINTELVKAPAFRDIRVTSGQTYFYSTTALDARGNESTRSEETSEQVP